MPIFSWEQATDAINNGAVGVLPTDTVYGLVCRADNAVAVTVLYALKDRTSKPGTLIAASVDQLIQLGIKARYLKPVQDYWPGAISVVIPTGSALPYLTQGKGSIAVRVVSTPPQLLTLLKATGPLLTSSANQPGMTPAGAINDAQSYFGESLDFYVDGGDLSGNMPSTIIRIVDDAIEVIREGAVAINEKGELQ